MKRTGPSPQTRAIVHERAGNCCERCGGWAGDGQIHHRQPRGMGGSRSSDANLPSNLLLLGSRCHAWVESHRSDAYRDGFLVRRPICPGEVAVLVAGVGTVLLTDDGRYVQVVTA